MRIWQTNPDLVVCVFAVIFTSLGYLLGNAMRKDELKHSLHLAYRTEDELNTVIFEMKNEITKLRSEYESLVSRTITTLFPKERREISA